jgi:hypothetical protein
MFTSACDHFTLNLRKHPFCAGCAAEQGSFAVPHPNSFSNACAPCSDDAGFCPVMSMPSVST